MSKILNIGFLSIVFMFCISFLLGGGSEDMFEIEKRELRSLPSLEEYSINEMPQAYTDYISDHFPLRRTIMKAAAVSSYKLFSSIRSDAVVIGENRFLFLNTMDNTSPKADYQGTNLFTQQQEDEILQIAEKLKEASEARGQKVVILVVPNKEEVYSQYLPDYFTRVNDTTRREQVCSLINAAGIDVVDVTDPLVHYGKTDDNIYHYADTHWNGKGAYIAAQKLLEHLEMDCVDYEENTFVEGGYYESDIANLCHLYDEYTDTHEYDAVSDIMTGKSDLSVTIVGDSFSWRIGEYFDESFSQVVEYSHSVTQDQLKNTKTDVLVIEIVERNLQGIASIMERAIY